MLGDLELDQLRGISNQYTDFKTLLSNAKTPNFSAFESVTPDINSAKDGISGLLKPDTSGLDTDSLINSVLNTFASGMSEVGSFKLNVRSSNEDGKVDGSPLAQLLKLILEIVELPLRFGYMAGALSTGTVSLVVGVEGLAKSFALGAKDIYLLIIAILKIVFKYFLCILSFILSTFGGCFFIHLITLFFTMIYLFIMYLVDLIHKYIGIDFSEMIDQVVDYLSWPEIIQIFCYSCFGQKVQLREVIADVSVLSDIGDMISYDFNITMPRYMKPSTPIGNVALDLLDKAIN